MAEIARTRRSEAPTSLGQVSLARRADWLRDILLEQAWKQILPSFRGLISRSVIMVYDAAMAHSFAFIRKLSLQKCCGLVYLIYY